MKGGGLYISLAIAERHELDIMGEYERIHGNGEHPSSPLPSAGR